ncbi:MAG: hypothetical protein M0Z67_11775 [Nitrospiraceae bacterium]|nr:hypothetical protein [Nitrospiraceae bacterium]
MNIPKVEGLIMELLAEIGEDPKREGLLNTPAPARSSSPLSADRA